MAEMTANMKQQIEQLEIIRYEAMSVIEEKCRGMQIKQGCIKEGSLVANCKLYAMCLANQTLKGLRENAENN